eukprot:3407508-Pleurochrysis_carterae.AAC.1
MRSQGFRRCTIAQAREGTSAHARARAEKKDQRELWVASHVAEWHKARTKTVKTVVGTVGGGLAGCRVAGWAIGSFVEASTGCRTDARLLCYPAPAFTPRPSQLPSTGV